MQRLSKGSSDLTSWLARQAASRRKPSGAAQTLTSRDARSEHQDRLPHPASRCCSQPAGAHSSRRQHQSQLLNCLRAASAARALRRHAASCRDPLNFVCRVILLSWSSDNRHDPRRLAAAARRELWQSRRLEATGLALDRWRHQPSPPGRSRRPQTSARDLLFHERRAPAQSSQPRLQIYGQPYAGRRSSESRRAAIENLITFLLPV